MMRGNEVGWQGVAVAAIRAATGESLDTPRWTSCGGSSLNATWRLDAGAARFFVKVNAAAREPMLEAEGDGLRELARANAVRVPAPVACGAAGDAAFLALEWLDLAAGGCDAALGRALAQLHRTIGAAHGWRRDNTIGTTPQDNARTDDWVTFFRDRRIAPQLALAARNGHGGALQRDGETAACAQSRRYSPVTPRRRRCCTATSGLATRRSSSPASP